MVYGQCGGLVQQVSTIPVGYTNLGVQNQLQGLYNNGLQQLSLPSGGCSGNLGNLGVVNSIGYGNTQLPYQSLDALSIATGSSYAPSGISVVADNLEIGGQVAVSGSMPFLGAIAVNGNVPTAGQGQVQYISAPGVGLTNGGCGYGLASSVPSNAYSGSVNGLNSLVGYGGGNVVGANLGGLSLGNGGSCGCNLY